jgi:hypothetical protein
VSVLLEIDDGDPWWLSPDIWVVPGDDPTGPPGQPVDGQSAYLWARVHNRGNENVSNATVHFYWANPATAVDRTTATLVGSSFVTLPAGASQEVLCLTPWIPSFVNDGHECVLAEAFESTLDPLPPGVDFNVPTDRHVAQLNLAVIEVAPHLQHFQLAFEAHNPSRKEGHFRLHARHGNEAELARLLEEHPLLKQLQIERGRAVELAFTTEVCPSEEAPREEAPEITLRPLERRGFTLTGRLEGGAALVHVVQLLDDKLVGGLSVAAYASAEQREADSE